MHKIGCDIGWHLHDLTYLMMQLKASSPNLMVHQQGFVQLFLNSRTRGVQGIPQNCKQLASVHTRFMRSILT